MDRIIKVIDAPKLMERWDITAGGLFSLLLNHRLRSVHKEYGDTGWIEDDWDFLLEMRYEKNADVTQCVFWISDILKFEEEYDELKSKSLELIRGRELLQRWSLTATEIGEVMDADILEAVDPVGIKMDFLDLQTMQKIGYSVNDFFFKIDEIKQIEIDHPEFVVHISSDISDGQAEVSSNNQSHNGNHASDSKNHLREKEAIPTFCFYKNGTIWKIGEQGKEKDFTHLKGFEYIRFLLQYENKTFDSMDVYYLGNIPGEIRKTHYEKRVDPKTRAVVLERKKELEEALSDGFHRDDSEDLHAELERYNQYLNDGHKSINKTGEDIRVNVTKSIKRAISTIAKETDNFPSLKHLLLHICLENPNKRIKTGKNMWYRPDSSNQIEWILHPPSN